MYLITFATRMDMNQVKHQFLMISEMIEGDNSRDFIEKLKEMLNEEFEAVEKAVEEYENEKKENSHQYSEELSALFNELFSTTAQEI